MLTSTLLKEVIEEAKDILTNQKQNYTEERYSATKNGIRVCQKSFGYSDYNRGS